MIGRKTIWAVAIIFSALPAIALAEDDSFSFAQDKPKTGFWLEEQTLITRDDALPQIDGTLWHNFDDRLGAYCWFMVGEKYAQAYAGPTLRLDDWLQVGAGLGMETSDDPLRFGSFVSVRKDEFSLLAIYETSKSDYWYKAELNYAASEMLGVGAMVQRFAGAGPRLEISLPGTPIKIWGAPLYDWEDKQFKGLIGLRWNF